MTVKEWIREHVIPRRDPVVGAITILPCCWLMGGLGVEARVDSFRDATVPAAGDAIAGRFRCEDCRQEFLAHDITGSVDLEELACTNCRSTHLAVAEVWLSR